MRFLVTWEYLPLEFFHILNAQDDSRYVNWIKRWSPRWDVWSLGACKNKISSIFVLTALPFLK
jgi:hypothetical protein